MKAAISNGIIVILSLLLIFGTGILKEKYVETKKLQP